MAFLSFRILPFQQVMFICAKLVSEPGGLGIHNISRCRPALSSASHYSELEQKPDDRWAG